MCLSTARMIWNYEKKRYSKNQYSGFNFSSARCAPGKDKKNHSHFLPCCIRRGALTLRARETNNRKWSKKKSVQASSDHPLSLAKTQKAWLVNSPKLHKKLPLFQWSGSATKSFISYIRMILPQLCMNLQTKNKYEPNRSMRHQKRISPSNNSLLHSQTVTWSSKRFRPY